MDLASPASTTGSEPAAPRGMHTSDPFASDDEESYVNVWEEKEDQEFFAEQARRLQRALADAQVQLSKRPPSPKAGFLKLRPTACLRSQFAVAE